MPTNASKPLPPTPGTTASADWHYVSHSDPQSSHQQILRLVRRLARSPILDVGAAQGMLGQALQGSGLIADAVEPHPGWAEHARPFYRQVFAAAIEAAALPQQEYAVIVCADVLEHTADPVAVLHALRQAARPDAVFIISLPNVAHLSARLLLLSGRWPQMERGIFDRTHLHFYTRATLNAMLHEAGLQARYTRPTPVPLAMVWPPALGQASLRLAMWLQRVALLIAPALFGFQWVVVASAASSDA